MPRAPWLVAELVDVVIFPLVRLSNQTVIANHLVPMVVIPMVMIAMIMIPMLVIAMVMMVAMFAMIVLRVAFPGEGYRRSSEGYCCNGCNCQG